MSQSDPLRDGISAVELIASMGDDLTVVNAARVSMAKHHTVLDEEKDSRLIRYLAKHNHWTPFSHVMVTMRLKMPIYVARQWFKHTVGFTRNEVSRRYVDDSPEFHTPRELRERAAHVKQGSSDAPIPDNDHMVVAMREGASAAHALYYQLLGARVAPEVARTVLPQSMYTEFYETASLVGYSRLCKLRLDAHAQMEIRQYAQSVHKAVREIAPRSWKELMSDE